MKMNCSQKQRGAVIPLVAIILPVLLLAAGWALDFGHVFVNKTRLQNALDAAALSAAIAINRDINKDTAAATVQGRKTFDTFIKTSGNFELFSQLNSGDLVFDYSKYITPFVPGETVKPSFVRVSLLDMMKVTPILIRVIPAFNKDISVPATATAGAVGNNCSITPFVMCIGINPLDKDCSDGGCFGYNFGEKTELSMACVGSGCPQEPLTAGIYSLLNLDDLPGEKNIYDALVATNGDPGYRDICVETPLSANTEYAWNDVYKGINKRFDSDTDTVSSTYAQYEAAGKGNDRRLMVALLGYCSGESGGKINIYQPGGDFCVFLTDKPDEKEKTVSIEMVRSCPMPGEIDPNNAVLNGPYKIVLFRSEKRPDS